MGRAVIGWTVEGEGRGGVGAGWEIGVGGGQADGGLCCVVNSEGSAGVVGGLGNARPIWT